MFHPVSETPPLFRVCGYRAHSFVCVLRLPDHQTTAPSSSVTPIDADFRRAQEFKKCKNLHCLLWKRKDLQDQTLANRIVSVPRFAIDRATSTEDVTVRELSLD